MNVDMSRGLVLKDTQELSVLGFIQVWISAGKRQLLNLGFRQKCRLVSLSFLVENSLANIDLKDLFTTPYPVKSAPGFKLTWLVLKFHTIAAL